MLDGTVSAEQITGSANVGGKVLHTKIALI